MKKLAVITLVLLLCASMVCPAAEAADKIAYVDLSRIFSEYSKTKDYDKNLGDKQTVYESERDKLVGDIKKTQEKLNLLNDKEKEAKKGDMEVKIKSLQDYDRQKQTDLRKEQDEKMKEILKDIEDAVKQYAEKEGYSLILNDRVLVYQAKSLDVTDKIVEIINKNYKK